MQMGVGPDGIAVGGVDPAAQGVPGSDGGDEQVTETVTVETSSVPPHHHIVHHHQSGIQDPATGGNIIFIVMFTSSVIWTYHYKFLKVVFV